MVVLKLMHFGGHRRPEIVAHVAQSHKHRQFRYPSGIYIDREYWDPFNEYVNSTHPANRQMNEAIDRFRDSIIDAYAMIIKNREPIENISEYIIYQQADPELIAQGRGKERSLQKIMREYLDKLTVMDYSASKIEMARRFLWNYIKMVGNERVDIALGVGSVSLFLGKIRQGQMGKLSNAHIQNICIEINRFLVYCKDLAYSNTTESMEYLKKFRKEFAPKEKTHYSLSEDVIKALLELPRLYKEEQFSRDVLVFGCMTGMRISDILNLKLKDLSSMVLDDGSIMEVAEIIHIKKNRRTIHPINDLASNLITKWASGIDDRPVFEFYRPMTRHQIIPHIKKLLKMTGMCNELVPVNQMILGKEVRKLVPLWSVHATHSGRVSFSAMYMERGGNIKTLQAVLDHKSLVTTMRYVPNKTKEQAILDCGNIVQGIADLDGKIAPSQRNMKLLPAKKRDQI